MFVAAMLGPELGARVGERLCEALSASGRLPESSDLRLYGPDDLHVTLFFLGPVAPEREAELERALEVELAGAEAPELQLTRGGAFPEPGRERVLWIGVRETQGQNLARLQERVARACQTQGFAPDQRGWSPHLTVARLRGGRRGPPFQVPPAFYELDLALPWKPARVELVESLAGGAARAYGATRAFPLVGEGGSKKGNTPA